MRHDGAADLKKQFSEHVVALLAGKDSAVVEAGKLTTFAWKRLCFEREDSLLLKFDRDGETSVLPLPYEEFFVDEAHVSNSLEDSCVTPSDRILIKKKSPGYQGPVEFQRVARAVGLSRGRIWESGQARHAVAQEYVGIGTS